MGLGPTIFIKLHSFLVAAEAACSKGDLPVVAVEAILVAVTGFATAALVTAPPAELAAAVPVLPRAAKGAAHPCSKARLRDKQIQIQDCHDIQERITLPYTQN